MQEVDKENNIEVTFIVPIYNKEKELRRCVESILIQKGASYEIILVNDGSTDASDAICEEYSAHKAIRFVSQHNQGVSVARNTGLSLAKGKWICFVDPDDYLTENFLQRMINHTNNDTEMISCCCNVVDDDKVNECHFFNGYILFTDETNVDPNTRTCSKKHLLLELMDVQYNSRVKRTTAIGVPWGKLYSRSFLEENHLRFFPELVRMQDNIFNMYAFEKAKKVLYIDEPLYCYTVDHIRGIGYRYSPKTAKAFESVISNRNSFLESRNLFGDPEIFDTYIQEVYDITPTILSTYYLHKNNPQRIAERVREEKEVFGRPEFQKARIRGLQCLKHRSRLQDLELWFIIHKHYWTLTLAFPFIERIVFAIRSRR